MDFCDYLSLISRSAFRMVEFYCFMKESHEEIDCSARTASRMLNFFLTIERALFDEKKGALKMCRKFLFRIFLKK